MFKVQSFLVDSRNYRASDFSFAGDSTALRELIRKLNTLNVCACKTYISSPLVAGRRPLFRILDHHARNRHAVPGTREGKDTGGAFF